MIPTDYAYSEVERLIKKFKALSSQQRRQMNEDATRLGYILPMFSALGWNITDINQAAPKRECRAVGLIFLFGWVESRASF
jgi:hypothetical protein